MTLPQLDSDRFKTEQGTRIIVQVPETHARRVLNEVIVECPLKYGDYDKVAFTSVPGIQSFRSLGSGRNAATEGVVEVPCVELSFFIEGDAATIETAVKAIYLVHPYEEPVIFLEPCLRALHVRGMDENNPNRFWNRAPEHWVPDAHRSGVGSETANLTPDLQ